MSLIPCSVPIFHSTCYIKTVYSNTRNKRVHGFFHMNKVPYMKAATFCTLIVHGFVLNIAIIMVEGQVSILPKRFSTVLNGSMLRYLWLALAADSCLQTVWLRVRQVRLLYKQFESQHQVTCLKHMTVLKTFFGNSGKF